MTPADEDWRAFLGRTDRRYRNRRILRWLLILFCVASWAVPVYVIFGAI